MNSMEGVAFKVITQLPSLEGWRGPMITQFPPSEGRGGFLKINYANKH